MSEKEHCDTCGIELDRNKNEDFFVETEDGCHVFCEVHWIDFEKRRRNHEIC